MLHLPNVRKKRARKRRTIKNSYVDLDSVTIEPGHGYIGWIPITKQKLKQRECQLLSIKITKIEVIVSDHMGKSMFYKIPPQILKTIADELFGDIDRWQGVNLSRVKKKISEFRDYYNIGKRWWDLHKTRSFGSVFWLRVFADIQQKIPNDSMFIAVLRDIFHASIKYANTKQQRLVNSGTVRKCDRIKQYLLSLHSSLDVAQFLIDEKQKNGEKSGRKANEFMMAKLRSQLTQIAAGNHGKKENEQDQKADEHNLAKCEDESVSNNSVTKAVFGECMEMNAMNQNRHNQQVNLLNKLDCLGGGFNIDFTQNNGPNTNQFGNICPVNIGYITVGSYVNYSFFLSVFVIFDCSFVLYFRIRIKVQIRVILSMYLDVVVPVSLLKLLLFQ